jgi:hypothetical protein
MAIVTRSDVPAAVVMGLGFLAFGLIMILRPADVRANFDRFADSWKENSWHPCKMPFWGLRAFGLAIGILAVLFFYVAYLGMYR